MMNSDDKHSQLIELLRKVPDREPPADLSRRIMQALPDRKRSLRQKLTGTFSSTVTFRLQPFRLAAMVCSLIAAFGLGMLVGNPVATTDHRNQVLPTMSTNDRASYFIGRGLLAAGEPRQAIRYLSHAAQLDPDDTTYGFWQGVAYGVAGDTRRERSLYRQVINLRPDYLPAMINLGHNLLESGDPDNALIMYNRALAIDPNNREALYNRGLIYHLKGEKKQEATAWKDFLQNYRTGKWAFRALSHLNDLGDFTYRVGQVGLRRIIINQAALLSGISGRQQEEISRLAPEIARTPSGDLNLVIFRQGDPGKAKQAALRLQSLFRNILADTGNRRINVSWFGQAETVRTVSGTSYELKSGLLLFSNPRITMKNNMEKRI